MEKFSFILTYDENMELHYKSSNDQLLEIVIKDNEHLLGQAFNGKQIACSIDIQGWPMQLLLFPIFSDGVISHVLGTAFDVIEYIDQGIDMERKHMDEFRKAIQILPNAIFKATKDEQGNIFKIFNEGALACEFQMTTEEIRGLCIEDIYPQELLETMVPAFKRAFSGETVEFLSEYQGRVFNNLVKPVNRESLNFCAISINENELNYCDEIVGYMTEITEHKETEKNLMHYINHDQLTGLPNRILFHDRLTQAIIHAENSKQKVALLTFDLDRFKLVNDSLGHYIGDLLLKAVAKRISKGVSNVNTVARVSGDGFAIILENVIDDEEAKLIAASTIQALSRPFIIQGHELYVSSSVGISLYPDDGRDIDMLIKNADIALHQAKEKGCNTYEKYQYEMDSKNAKRLKLEGDLRKAIEKEEFVIHYQPQIDTTTGEVVGMEALLRWNHPHLGMIAPNEFIPVAEETGMIINIGEWVLRESCLQAKRWQNAGYEPKRISVNLSAKQFQQDDLVFKVAKILKETELDPSYLVLEITESISMHNIDFVTKTLQELNDLGIQVSIDDFGTGYSSLLYLKRFPIQSLKIDRSFIRDITSDTDDAAIALAVIAMAHSLKLKVIAEGVETKEQMQYLKEHRCDNLQGFLLGKPVPATDFEISFLKKNS